MLQILIPIIASKYVIAVVVEQPQPTPLTPISGGDKAERQYPSWPFILVIIPPYIQLSTITNKTHLLFITFSLPSSPSPTFSSKVLSISRNRFGSIPVLPHSIFYASSFYSL